MAKIMAVKAMARAAYIAKITAVAAGIIMAAWNTAECRIRAAIVPGICPG